MAVNLIVMAALITARIALSRFAKKKPDIEIYKQAGEIVETAAIAYCIIFLIFRPLIAQPFVISSDSMMPTLKSGDRVLVNHLTTLWKIPSRGDIVVFSHRDSSADQAKDVRDLFVKRVIGLPGDTISIHNGLLSINGDTVREPYLIGPIPYELPAIDIPSGKLFVLGDNRADSLDSHRWGLLDSAEVQGTVACVLWPPRSVNSSPLSVRTASLVESP